MERPLIKGNEPIVETTFYKWLQSEDAKGNDVDNFINVVLRYFEPNEAPFKGSDYNLSYHKAVFETFSRDKYYQTKEALKQAEIDSMYDKHAQGLAQF